MADGAGCGLDRPLILEGGNVGDRAFEYALLGTSDYAFLPSLARVVPTRVGVNR
jgi:hypothetical protein